VHSGAGTNLKVGGTGPARSAGKIFLQCPLTFQGCPPKWKGTMHVWEGTHSLFCP